MDTTRLDTTALTSIVQRYVNKAVLGRVELADILNLAKDAFIAGAKAVVDEVNKELEGNKEGI